MSTIDIGFEKEIISGLDSVVIRNYVDGIKGGKVLDMDGFTPEVLKCGHVIIKNKDDVYKPFPLNDAGDAYGTLPENHTIVGLATTSIEWAKQGSFVGIITAGEVNDKALPYDITDIEDDIKSAVPTLRFDHD